METDTEESQTWKALGDLAEQVVRSMQPLQRQQREESRWVASGTDNETCYSICAGC